jgi:hypothetical protein
MKFLLSFVAAAAAVLLVNGVSAFAPPQAIARQCHGVPKNLLPSVTSSSTTSLRKSNAIVR